MKKILYSLPVLSLSLLGASKALAYEVTTTAEDLAGIGTTWFGTLLDTFVTVITQAPLVSAVVLLGIGMYIFRWAKRAITGGKKRR